MERKRTLPVGFVVRVGLALVGVLSLSSSTPQASCTVPLHPDADISCAPHCPELLTHVME